MLYISRELKMFQIVKMMDYEDIIFVGDMSGVGEIKCLETPCLLCYYPDSYRKTWHMLLWLAGLFHKLSKDRLRFNPCENNSNFESLFQNG